MTRIKIPGPPPNQTLGYSKAEKRKMIALAIAFVLVVGAFGTSYLKSRDGGDIGDMPANVGEVMEEKVEVPEIDTALLESLVHDRREDSRVILENDAVDAALKMVRALTTRHFEVMEAQEMNEALVTEILADPAAFRGKPYTLRGRIDSMRRLQRDLTGPEEHLGRLVLEDDSIAYFLTTNFPDNIALDGFVRVDGLLLKAYSAEDETESGKWLSGPLIVGPKVMRSYASMGKVTQFHPRYLLEIEDQVIEQPDGSYNRDLEFGLPFEPLWQAMAYVRDLPPDAVDWNAVPEIDNQKLMDIMRDGKAHRLQPFRFPICRIQHATVKRAGENPARMEYFTEGWIGNIAWNNVVFFKSPLQDRDVKLTDFAIARGFFFVNFAYNSANRGIRVAPVFIVHSLEVVDPEPAPVFSIIAYTLAGGTMLLTVVFILRLRSDRKRSDALQDKLLKRRQARRKQGAPEVGSSTS